MNLYDVVSRIDRMLEVESGCVTAEIIKIPGGSQRAIHLRDDAKIWLRAAHTATALRHFPTQPGWVVHLGAGASLEVWLDTGSGASHRMFVSASVPGQSVHLTWPAPVPVAFDLRLIARGDVAVAVGPVFNPRARLLPRLTGRGVEVGPGANPAVLPTEEREVSYIERMPMSQWASTYAKEELAPAVAGLWDRYVVDSAQSLSGIPDGSLDFVFSSHVIEHLVNPIGVFRNWWAKLAPGGMIAGVIPDARFTFDLRQPLTTQTEFLTQLAVGDFEPTESMYERWCLYTSPENTPESLRKREYSIHVNYFSSDSFRSFLDILNAGPSPAGLFIEATTNGKDFGFMVVKP